MRNTKYSALLGVLLCLSIGAFAARSILGPDIANVLGVIFGVLVVAMLLLGRGAKRTPKEIPSFGDPELDGEIDRVLRRRSPEANEKK